MGQTTCNGRISANCREWGSDNASTFRVVNEVDRRKAASICPSDLGLGWFLVGIAGTILFAASFFLP